MYHTHCHTGLEVDKLEGDGGVEGIFMARQEKEALLDQKVRVYSLLLFSLESWTSFLALRPELSR